MVRNTKQFSESGFTIIEIVMTLFIIGTMLLMYQVALGASRNNKYNINKEIALRIAEKEIATLRTTPFASIPASGAISDTLLSSLPSGAGTRTVTVVEEGLKSIRVDITWRNPGKATNQTLYLNTVISKGGLGK